jgi:dihydrolipoamide dehydrogenase
MLKVGDETISFVNLIIATGSVPSGSPFEIEDGANVINSDGFLELKELPESAIIIGGGVIGLEFATVMANAGKEVTVIEAAPKVLPAMDKELAAVSKAVLENNIDAIYQKPEEDVTEIVIEDDENK